MAQQLGFYLDQSTCVGCFACQMACKDWYDTETEFFRRVKPVEEGTWPHVRLAFLSQACHHCEQPICVEVCPTGAYTKREDGIVVLDSSKCIGCRYCIWACPYSAPKFVKERNRVEKCNFCYDRIDEGQEPICVAACITRALRFGPIESVQAPNSVTRVVAGLPDPNLTKPAFVVTPPTNLAGTGKTVTN